MLYYQGFGGIDGVLAGSKHCFLLKSREGLVEKILHDCGSNLEESPEEKKKRGLSLPFQVSNLDAVVISHDHDDHAGELYRLRLNQYSGRYYGHEATRDLVEMDLQQFASREAEQSKRENRGEIFNYDDSRSIMERFQGLMYGTTVQLSKNIKATLYDAGHIVGSAQVLYEINDEGRTIKILTCVDLGRSDIDVPVIRYPHTEFPKDIDYCFIESTYGGKKHSDREKSRGELEQLIMTIYKEKRRATIATFAKMRSLILISDSYHVFQKLNFPSDFKIYLDSPVAVQSNRIMISHKECLDPQARIDSRNKFWTSSGFPNLQITRNRAESARLDTLPGPYIILTAAGMFNMGRSPRHLKNHIEDPRAIVCTSGYQVPGTSGWQLEQGKEKFPKLMIEGREYKYNAQFFRLRGYSAHADGNDCIRHVLENVKPRKKVFIVHGETESQNWTLAQFTSRGISAEIPRFGKIYEL